MIATPTQHNQPAGAVSREKDRVSAADARSLERVIEVVHRRTGHSFEGYKPAGLLRRIRARMRVKGCDSLEAYAGRIEAERGEAAELFKHLLIGVSQFFRDPEVFAGASDAVLPSLFDAAAHTASGIRVWIPGCSTGEEVYTLSMLLLEAARQRNSAVPIKIFATDIDADALARARSGMYAPEAVNSVPEPFLSRYFTRENGLFRVTAEVRSLCVFALHNLAYDPPFSRLDLIACRNVLIYFENQLQAKVLQVFHNALKPEGFLLLGRSEGIPPRDRLFAAVDKKRRIYRRHDGAPAAPGLHSGLRAQAAQAARVSDAAGPQADARGSASGGGSDLLACYESTGIAVLCLDARLRVLGFSTAATDLFRLSAADKGREIMDVPASVDTGLIAREARRVLETLESCQVELRKADSDRWFAMKAVPYRAAGAGCVSISFFEITEQKRAQAEIAALNEALDRRVAERSAEIERRSAQLSRLAHQLLEVEQNERKRLSMVIHDQLQQILVAARMRLLRLERDVNAEQGKALEDSVGLVDEAIRESRSLTTELSPPLKFDSGIAPAMESLLRWVEEKHRLKVDFIMYGEDRGCRDEIGFFLYRSVRELLFNVVKHSGAEHAGLEIVYEADGGLCVRVRDEGKGFNPGQLEQFGRRYGLFSLMERIEMLGGRCSVESKPGEGTLVALEFPFATLDRGRKGPSRIASPDTALEDVPGDIRVLVVDDQRVVREGLALMIAEAPGIRIVGEGADGNEAVEKTRALRPDVVLMDVGMPRLNGIEATRRIKAEFPEVSIIAFSMHEEPDLSTAMRHVGASDYLLKSAGRERLLDTIRRWAPCKPGGMREKEVTGDS